MGIMHEIQRRLLALAEHDDIAKMSLRKVGERVGVQHAAQVRHHLNYLVKQGRLVKNAAGSFAMPDTSLSKSTLLTIPFMGEADCGEATMLATGQVQGYLSISPRMSHYTSTKNLYTLKAKGDSMDRASINGKSIEDSDYVLVHKCNASEVSDGDYIVSIFDSLANIKRLHIDRAHNRVVLLSESHRSRPPIIIAAEDMDYYEIVGKVVDVIKGIKHLS
jgi:SOS-response transcriptional repressor LexA